MSINDHWTLDLDGLGMRSTGEALARQILTCRPPYAVCVQGKWGSGKTSVMRYAMARLGGQPLTTMLETAQKEVTELPPDLKETWDARIADSKGFIEGELRKLFLTEPASLEKKIQVVPIWFNPWQHQTAPIPVVALLHELRQQFSHRLRFANKTSKLVQVSVEAGLSMIGGLLDTFSALQGGPTGAGQAVGKIRQVGEAYEARRFETLHDAQRISLLFHEAVGRLLRAKVDSDGFPNGKSGEPVALRRLVIFIDDLDRCAESQTVHLLESIKLYLQTPHCVFVFGMDSAAARRAVHKELGQIDEVAREYLEKLFQTTIHVPLPTRRESFVAKQLKALGKTEHETDEAVKDWARKIVALVEPNPRKLKNFINVLVAGWNLGPDGEPNGFGLHLLVTYLRCYHPDVCRLISYDPEQVAALHRALSEDGPKSQKSPADFFLVNAFRHAFDLVHGFGDEGPLRGDSDAVVDELTERLDRHRSDRAFLRQWRDLLGDLEPEEAVPRLRPFLRMDEPATEAEETDP